MTAPFARRTESTEPGTGDRADPLLSLDAPGKGVNTPVEQQGSEAEVTWQPSDLPLAGPRRIRKLMDVSRGMASMEEVQRWKLTRAQPP